MNSEDRYVAPEGNDHAEGNSGGAPPECNQNARSHGVFSTPEFLIDDLDENELEWIEAITDGYLEVAPFGPEDPRAERLAMTAVKVYQSWAAENAMLRDGLSEEQTVGVTDSGDVVTETDAHHLRRASSQLSKEVRLTLKDLGCLPDPDSQQAAATRSLAEVLSGRE